MEPETVFLGEFANFRQRVIGPRGSGTGVGHDGDYLPSICPRGQQHGFQQFRANLQTFVDRQLDQPLVAEPHDLQGAGHAVMRLFRNHHRHGQAAARAFFPRVAAAALLAGGQKPGQVAQAAAGGEDAVSPLRHAQALGQPIQYGLLYRRPGRPHFIDRHAVV